MLRAAVLRRPRAVAGRARRRVSDAPPKEGGKEKEAAGWPWYLKLAGYGGAVGGTGLVGVLLLQNEINLRHSADAIAPQVVDLVRGQWPFPDEDPERRAYVKAIENELASGSRVVFSASTGRRAVLPPTTLMSDARAAVGCGHDLAVDFEDVRDDDVGGALGAAEEEAAPAPAMLPLERLAARRGPSVWAPPPRDPSEHDADAERKARIGGLKERRARIGEELAGGMRSVDDVTAEVAAIEKSLRELEGKGGGFWRRR